MDRQITISVGRSRKEMHWTSLSMQWLEFAEKLKTPQRTQETYDAYMKLPKSQQDELKDVGGFVGGALNAPRRKPANVTGRDLVTLDLDNIPPDMTQQVIKKVTDMQCAAVVYSTRKHSSAKPRLRICFPTDRTMLPDEYEPIARRLASIVGLEYADPTTFEVSRLMYWPSCSSDSEYVYYLTPKDLPFIKADTVLSMYEDWKDVASWPRIAGEDVGPIHLQKKQEDPLEKEGLIGAFCRTYSITDAIEKFIPQAYEETDLENRLTYLGGSTTGGALLFGDKFMYSYHATDPTSLTLVNAWDLIRIHKFGDLDAEAKPKTPIAKMPSWLAMCELARSDKKVMVALDRERLQKARDTFDRPAEVSSGVAPASDDDIDWMLQLSRTKKTGAIESTVENIKIILANDPDLRGKIAIDSFADRCMAVGALPWNSNVEHRFWVDVDDSGVRCLLENRYHVTGAQKVEDALRLTAKANQINPVEDYFKNLTWDGKKRLDTFLHDYLGAEQNVYTAAVWRKSLVAAVARAIKGAVKWDYMPILVGPQGIGKSTVLAKVGMDWFCDSLEDFKGKDAAEIIRGRLIIEIGELAAFSRSETNDIKQFLSKDKDIFRAAYGRHSEEHDRRCVFFGTSNDVGFLRDRTGNRRFWPVTLEVCKPKYSVFIDLTQEVVDQLWAEAYALFLLGTEKLFLTGEEYELSKQAQEEYREVDDKEGLIQEYLEREVPNNWDELSLGQRKQFLQGNLETDRPLMMRTKICALEVWCECLNGDPRYMKRRDSLEINNALSSIRGWRRTNTPRKYGYCGSQRGFERISK